MAGPARPQEDYYRVFQVRRRGAFVHAPSFPGLQYTADFILLELAFISGRSKETRFALLQELSRRLVDRDLA
jgi:hypothetical protein